jgi:uroporphyrinogen-III decarboxylase
METTKNWADMTWQEKREERFKRWLSPKNVKFVSKEAEKLYKARVTRFIKSIKMEEGDRVPCMLPTGYFPAYYAGFTFHDIMYDYDKLKRAWLKYLHDFKDADSASGPSLVIPGRILDALDLKTMMWPGHGLSEDAWYYQHIEREYMKADEYDRLTSDPSDYTFRFNLPRAIGLLQAFERLPPLRSFQGSRLGLVNVLADPEIRKAFQKMIDLGEEYDKWQAVVKEVSQTALAEGLPNVRGGMGGAPFDTLADFLRGTQGISIDLFRQPEKVIRYVEAITPQMIENVLKTADKMDCPLVSMPLHKGDDVFMSDKQFEKFYWPTYQRMLLAMINEGLVPFPFAEGKHNRRLNYYADMPKSGVVWYFDQTDMKEAKKILGNTSCIVGNVPASIVITGTKQQVKERCRELIETCAPGGGYILSGGASVDKCKAENLHVMMEAVEEYGQYK